MKLSLKSKILATTFAFFAGVGVVYAKPMSCSCSSGTAMIVEFKNGHWSYRCETGQITCKNY